MIKKLVSFILYLTIPYYRRLVERRLKAGDSLSTGETVVVVLKKVKT